MPKAATATSTRYRPERSCNANEESRQVGAVELTARPMAAANVCSTKAKVAAATAPATIGPHWRYSTYSSSSSSTARGTRSVMVIDRSFCLLARSAQAEEREQEHDHNDQANEVDDAVHGASP